MEKIITSKDNKLIKDLKNLKLKKYRDSEGKFLAEGIKFLNYTNYIPEMIIAREDILKNNTYLGKFKNFDVKKVFISKKIFSELSSQDNSQGILILYSKKDFNINNVSSDVVVLDNVSDPGNLGTIIRVCDATKFNNIILTKGSVDAYNDKVIRASMGSILNVNLFYMEREEIIKYLKEKNYKIFVTYLDKDAVPFNKIETGEKNAFIFGNEGKGVGDDFSDISDTKVIIPILGRAESLNVAISSAIILYKLRERQGLIG